MENPDEDLKYYDLIIDINSFKNLYKNGWDVKATKKGLENYEKYKEKNKLPVIGVIGNGNVGKSYLLQKITGNEIPVGFSVKTKGLSVCYPSSKEKSYVLLDTAGFESPILQNEFYKINYKEEKNNENEKKDEKQKEIDKQNEIDNNIRRTIIDKKLVNFFLENFIIKNSDILIFVLNQMTKSDQLFLNKVKKRAINKTLIVVHNLKNFIKIDQCEYYIKNYLMNNLDFKLSEENFTVFNSEKLEDKNVIKFFKEKEMFDMKKKENEYYKEEVKTRNVLHIILANDDISNENNEAGKHFNKKSIDFIQSKILEFTDIQNFDIIEKIKALLIKKQNDLFTQKIPDVVYKNNKIMFDKNVVHVENINENTTEDDLKKFFEDCGKIKKITIEKKNKQNVVAKIGFSKKSEVENCLKKNGQILNENELKIEWKSEKFKGKLKRVLEDYLGNEIFEGDVIIPFYRDFIKKNKDDKTKGEYVVEFEMPVAIKKKKDENKNEDDFKLKVSKINDKKNKDLRIYTFIISGDKKKPERKEKINLRNFGKFKLKIERKFENIKLDDIFKPEINHKNGVHKYIWKVSFIEKKEDEKDAVEEEIIVGGEKKKSKKKKKKETKDE